jgi:hypothetical protein
LESRPPEDRDQRRAGLGVRLRRRTGDERHRSRLRPQRGEHGGAQHLRALTIRDGEVPVLAGTDGAGL